MRHSTTYGSVCVLAAAVLWGTTGTAAALAPDVGSLAVGAAAMGVGGLLQATAALRILRAHRAGLTAQWRTLLVSAVAVAVYPLAFYSSMRLAGVAVGTVVSIGSAPMAAALIERVVDHRRLARRWAIGAAVGVLGMLALAVARAGAEGAATDAVRAQPVLGFALGLLAGVTYALYSWGAARVMRRGLPSRPVMGAVFGVGGVLLLPVLLLTGAPIVASWWNFAAVAYLAVVPMFLGYVLFGRGLAAVSASTATSLSLLEPAIAAVIAVVVLGERLSVLGWAGMTVLLASLVVLTAPPRREGRGTPGSVGGIRGCSTRTRDLTASGPSSKRRTEVTVSAHSGHRSTSRSTSQTCSIGASTSILVLCSTGPSCSSSLLEIDQDQVPHTSCTLGFRYSW